MIGGCSNNQLLAWNGSNWNCASVSSLGGVLGSGTDNYLARWNGTGALERSTIYETDGGQVGIGVTSPNDTFEIAGNVTIGSGYAGSTVSAPANGLLVEGFVGIGSTNPTSLLSIGSGNGFRVDANGVMTAITGNLTNLYIGGTQVTASAESLNLLTGVSNPLLTNATNFSGDVSGLYNNLQLGATTVGQAELVDTGITAANYGGILSGTTGYYPIFTVDADGRLTNASTVPFTFENPLSFINGLSRIGNTIGINVGVGLTTTGAKG
jgi:hypothetical protein